MSQNACNVSCSNHRRFGCQRSMGCRSGRGVQVHILDLLCWLAMHCPSPQIQYAKAGKQALVIHFEQENFWRFEEKKRNQNGCSTNIHETHTWVLHLVNLPNKKQTASPKILQSLKCLLCLAWPLCCQPPLPTGGCTYTRTQTCRVEKIRNKSMKISSHLTGWHTHTCTHAHTHTHARAHTHARTHADTDIRTDDRQW